MTRLYVKLSPKSSTTSNIGDNHRYHRFHRFTIDRLKSIFTSGDGFGNGSVNGNTGGSGLKSHHHHHSDSFRLGKIILPLLMFSVLLYLIPYIRIDKSSYDPNGITDDQLITLKHGRSNLSEGGQLKVGDHHQQQQLINTLTCTINQPISNIFFLKTHKCASSAIQRIFLKYGYLNQKIFALPRSGNYLGHPESFDRSLLSPSFYGSYNIFAVHTRFNLGEISTVMPSDTLYITILRNPLALYESMFGYWNLTKFYNLPRNFLDLPFVPIERLQSSRWIGKIGANQMFFDLGYDPVKLTDSMINSILPKLDQVFDLVMIAEKFDESLILLKDKLCWSFDDIITFKINARPQRKKLSSLAEERIKIINWADVKLYSYFLNIFDLKVKAYGEERMASDLAKLRAREATWYSECVFNETISWGKSTSSVVRFINRQPSNLTCVLLTAAELEVINFLRRKQRRFHPGSIRNW